MMVCAYEKSWVSGQVSSGYGDELEAQHRKYPADVVALFCANAKLLTDIVVIS